MRKMEPNFLFSSVPNGYGHQFLRLVTNNSYSVIAFVKDFNTVGELSSQYPGVTWIVIDLERSQDDVLKCLKVLPTFNYIVNFSGIPFLDTSSNFYRTIGISLKVRERGRSELTLHDIVYEDDKERRVLVNVVEKRSELKKTSKVVSKLVKGTKKTLSSLAQDDSSDEENSPLIPGPSHGVPAQERSEGLLSLIIRVLSFCFPCFFPQPDPEYCFRNPQELLRQMQSEELNEIHARFRKLHDKSLAKWNSRLDELHQKESKMMEDLVEKIESQKKRETADISKLKDQQNANTRDRLSGVLKEEVLKKIEASRSGQTSAKTKSDADRKYREGQTLISKQVAVERTQLIETHYVNLVTEQLQLLAEIQSKYKKKTRNLHDRYFRNRT